MRMMLSKIARHGGRAVKRVPLVYRLSLMAKRRARVPLPEPARARRVLLGAAPYVPNELPEKSPIKDPEVDITVIVPCYRVENYVQECVESILDQQTSCTFEVIAIDDGSPDGTGGLLDRIAARDSRVRVIHQDNRGLSGARNAGMARARGRLLMFVDSDDRLQPGAIQLLHDVMMREGSDFSTGKLGSLSEDGSSLRVPKARRNHGGVCGRLYRREIFDRLRFPEHLWFEDTVQAYCIESRCSNAYVDEVVYERRNNPTSISHVASGSKKGADTYWVVENMLDWCDELGIELDSALYDQTIVQFGALAFERTEALDDEERRAFFVLACDLIDRDRWKGARTSLPGKWADVEHALRTRNYKEWLYVASVL